MINVRLVKIKNKDVKQPHAVAHIFWCDCGNIKQRRSEKSGGFSLYEKHFSERQDTPEEKGKATRVGHKYNKRVELAIICCDCDADLLKCDLSARCYDCIDKLIPKELAEANGIPRGMPKEAKTGKQCDIMIPAKVAVAQKPT